MTASAPTVPEQQPGPSDAWIDSGWQAGVIRPLLIAAMAACLMAGPLVVAQAIFPDLALDSVLSLCFLTALLGVLSTRWLAKPTNRLVHRALFRLSELVVIVALLRLATWLLSGNWPAAADLRRWILEPLTFLDGAYVIAILLGSLAWNQALIVADIFEQLALSRAELAWRQEQDSGQWRQRMPLDLVRISRQDQDSRLATSWLTGGGLLVFCAGLTRVRLASEGLVRLVDLGLSPQLLLAIIAYFLIGLVLVSQARLAMLRARWLYDGVEGLGDMPSRWQRLSLWIILGIGLLAALLPLGSTWQMGRILGLILGVLSQLAYALFFGLFALFAGLLGLLGLAVPQVEETSPPLPEVPAVQPPVPLPAESTLPPWLAGAGFWLVAGGILIYAVIFLLGKRGIALNRHTVGLALSRVLAWLQARWLGVRDLAESIQLSLPRRGSVTEETAQTRQPWRFIRLGALPPREKIRYFYLSTVRRAGDQGLARRPSQTPREYAQALESAWPEAELDVEALTEAFVIARYDRTEISEPEAKDVQSIWQRVRKALRGQRSQIDRGSP